MSVQFVALLAWKHKNECKHSYAELNMHFTPLLVRFVLSAAQTVDKEVQKDVSRDGDLSNI